MFYLRPLCVLACVGDVFCINSFILFYFLLLCVPFCSLPHLVNLKELKVCHVWVAVFILFILYHVLKWTALKNFPTKLHVRNSKGTRDGYPDHGINILYCIFGLLNLLVFFSFWYSAFCLCFSFPKLFSYIYSLTSSTVVVHDKSKSQL